MAQLMPLPLTVSCFSKIQSGFTFLVPADLGSPGKRAVKRVCVCVCLYGLEACPLTKFALLSMDFVINRFLMKLFKTSNANNVKYCQECFSFDMPSGLWRKRVTNFESKFTAFYLKV